MLRRRYILVMIAAVLLTTCLLAAAKLRATPKYDRIEVGMTEAEVEEILGPSCPYCDEGHILLDFEEKPGGPVLVIAKQIERRNPLERLAWLAGWRPDPPVLRSARP